MVNGFSIYLSGSFSIHTQSINTLVTDAELSNLVSGVSSTWVDGTILMDVGCIFLEISISEI